MPLMEKPNELASEMTRVQILWDRQIRPCRACPAKQPQRRPASGAAVPASDRGPQGCDAGRRITAPFVAKETPGTTFVDRKPAQVSSAPLVLCNVGSSDT